MGFSEVLPQKVGVTSREPPSFSRPFRQACQEGDLGEQVVGIVGGHDVLDKLRGDVGRVPAWALWDLQVIVEGDEGGHLNLSARERRFA